MTHSGVVETQHGAGIVALIRRWLAYCRGRSGDLQCFAGPQLRPTVHTATLVVDVPFKVSQSLVQDGAEADAVLAPQREVRARGAPSAVPPGGRMSRPAHVPMPPQVEAVVSARVSVDNAPSMRSRTRILAQAAVLLGGHLVAKITYDLLRGACQAGGPSVLVSTTELAPAGGPMASVAPARFVTPGANSHATYAYEHRFVDGAAARVVILDSKQSQLNRAEASLAQAIADGVAPLTRVPHVEVTYSRDGERECFTDLELPHRAYDGHIRAGSVGGKPATEHPTYRAARNATPANARALLEFSPITLVYGGWDATRKSRQGRWRSALVGEIIGVLADQSFDQRSAPMRGGARVDPVAMQVQLGKTAMIAIADAQRGELSPKLYEKIVKAAKSADEKAAGPTSASTLGLGGIPPTLEQLAGVACTRIVRTHVLSLATLRQIRFGTNPDGDAACRALLAALALNGLVRSDAELYLRANCDLVEAGPTCVSIDRRAGSSNVLEPLDIPSADALLAEAIDAAGRDAGVAWSGQVFAVEGNPEVIASADDAAPEE